MLKEKREEKDAAVGILVDLNKRDLNDGEKVLMVLEGRPDELCFEAALRIYPLSNNTFIPLDQDLVYW